MARLHDQCTNQNIGNIFVVDDEPLQLELLAEMLRRNGHKVRTAENGKEALLAISKSHPDIILLDIMMPQMDGFEICRNLKADPQTTEIPILFISAKNSIIDKLKGFEFGGVDFISKPYNTEEVLARVETHICLHYMRKKVQEQNRQLQTEITEREKAEKEREQLAMQLLHSRRMEAIGTLAGGIAHEFNNILGSILGYTDMVKDDLPLDSRLQTDLDKVMASGYRARNLVKQILSLSPHPGIKRVLLKPAVLTRENLRVLKLMLPSSITVTENINPDCGQILADTASFQQVMNNLCENAQQALVNTGGQIEIVLETITLTTKEVNKLPTLHPGRYIRLTVSDSGPGVDPDIRDKIFDPYFTTKDIDRGSGMGLAVVQGIMHNLGGTVVVSDSQDHGATFHAYFPEANLDSRQEETIDEPRTREVTTILYISGDEMLAQMSKKMINRLGHAVITRNNSRSALSAYETAQDNIDLVITDMILPDGSGIELAQSLLKIKPHLPIILCTSTNKRSIISEAKTIGIFTVTSKPFTKSELESVINKALSTDPQ